MSKKIDIASLVAVTGTMYPPPFDQPCRARERKRMGDAAGFKAGDGDGHCLQNRSGAAALVLEIGTRIGDDAAHYSDIDMVAPARGVAAPYRRRDGTPYTDIKRRGPEDWAGPDFNPSSANEENRRAHQGGTHGGLPAGGRLLRRAGGHRQLPRRARGVQGDGS